MAEPQIHVPDGLLTMLEGLAKSVIKKKPQDIPLFALYYFAKLKEFRKGHPNFNIKKLVKEFHNGTAEGLPVNGLEEELQKMGYLMTGSVQSDQTEDSVVISCDVQILIIPDESQDSGAVSSATTQSFNQQTLSSTTSCTGTRSKTNNVPLPSLSTDTTKPSTYFEKIDVTAAAGEPLAREVNLTIQKIEERVQNEASAALVCQPSMGATATSSQSCNVPRADVSTATEVSVCSVQCQTSVVSQHNQQVITDIAGGQCSQNLQSTEASQVTDNTSLTARQEDPVVSPTESSQNGCAIQCSRAREQLQSPCLCGSGASIQPAHPWTLYPFNYWNAWNPVFFDASLYHYHPSHNQHFCYPYYFHHPRRPCCSHSSYRCDSAPQKPPEQKRRGEESSFCASRGCFPVMPFYQNFQMPSSQCTCRHRLPAVQIPAVPCSAVKGCQAMQMKNTQFKQTSTKRSPQAHPMKDHQCIHPPHTYLPPFAPMGQHPHVHAAMPSAFVPAQPFQSPSMENPDWTAATHRPYSAPHHSAHSHEPCHLDSNNC